MTISYIYELATCCWHYLYNGIIVCLSVFLFSLWISRLFSPSKYPDILQSLFTIAQSRRNGRILDNVLGAVCRMIMVNQRAVPLGQVGRYIASYIKMLTPQ